MSLPAVKICCISSKEEAKIAIDYGASAIGLVSKMPSGPGVISEQLIADIAATVPKGIDTFLLTSLQKASKIIAQHRRCQTSAIQLVDKVAPQEIRAIKKSLPQIDLVQVIHVTGEKAVQQAVEIAPYVDILLLDSGNPDLETKELGGTGRIHNWDISREIVLNTDVPIFLAGGLNPQNILKAITTVKPYGIDICSGLRSNGVLDRSKTARFFKEMKAVSQ
ncbi:phosphoribosylanthranilate isomerase [Aliifodinibius sp. S!AR15-10]|uniref:phosphoribosylanthranilate isomerase n=1 Tax=Aliifodinibius sp. S!AR15-10 TaxID=2950437 RepID=UPI0028595D7F|nr:phosphoribosylanthranilate isomerase [Aliifodinibius sp. S!AR15-10]MDR8392485.1 phosphoribosylanthranilate isomerase [Aliifodinibius sp. S!AR15-10]